jgi:hypothetical protein
MEGKAMYRKLRSYLVGPELRTLPHTQFAIVAEGDDFGLGRGANTHEPGSTPQLQQAPALHPSYCAYN